MTTENLTCILKATRTLNDTDEAKVIRPIGFATKVIARYYPQDFVECIYHGYHRGDASPTGVINDFLRGNVPLFKQPSDPYRVYAAGLKFVQDKFAPPFKYKPVHFADLRYYDWELGTSAEEPLVSDPLLVEAVAKARARGDLPNSRMSKSVLYNAAFGYNRTYVHNIKEAPAKTDFRRSRTHFYTCTAHARSHLTPIEDPAKTRMVFGIPWLFLMVEMMLLWPLMNWLRKGLTPIAWTYEIMTGGMNRINSLTKPNDLYLCLDWSQFDKRTRYIFIDQIHAMWKSWMDNSSGYIATPDYPTTTEPHSPAEFAKRINNLWRWMNAYIKDMHIKLPDDSIWRKNHAGIASGFMQTQILDSFINLFMLITILIYLRVPLPDISIVLGDDSVLIIRSLSSINVEDLLSAIASAAEQLFGAKLNVQKSKVTPDPNQIHFLGYQNQNGTPVRSEEDMLSKLVHPEREWDAAKVKARALGFAYANCGVNERVHQVCKEIFEGYPNIQINEKGSDFLRYYREHVETYSPTQFPDRVYLLDRLFHPPQRSNLDENFWPPWLFTSDH